MRLYHGTNLLRFKLTKDSRFTKSLKSAKDYAYFWTEEYGGKPQVFVIEGRFEFVGGADQYKLKGKKYKIIKRLEV